MALIQVLQQLRQELLLFNPIILSLLLLISAFSLFKFTRSGRVNLPPSPPRLPILGNLHQIGKLPHRSLRALSEKYGPIMLVHFGNVPVLVISSADIARDVFKTHDASFSSRPQIKVADVMFYGCSDIAFCPYGEYWRQAKKLSVLELLSLKRVQSFQFVREEEVAELIEKIRCSCLNGSPVNLCEMLGTISTNIISRCALGQKCDGINGDKGSGELSRRVMELIGAFSFKDYFPYMGWMDFFTGLDARLKETSGSFHAFLDQVIDQHQTPKIHNEQIDKKDFIDIVLNLQMDGLLEVDLTRDNLKAILLDIFVGGSDTSAATMEWTMAELAKNPTKMKKAQEEVRRVVGKKLKVDEADLDQMDYFKCVIKESLRLHASFLIPRETTTSVTLAGYEIPPKTRVMINSWSIQRDPKSWDKPEEFLPERFLNNSIDLKGQDPQFVPFGSGRRGCPGTSFALVEIEYVIANLLFWFDWKLPGDAAAEDLDMSDAHKQVLCKKIPLTLVPAMHTA